MISVQYQILHRKSNESAQECIGRLWVKVTECEYKEYNGLLIEQFINGLHDQGMISETLREVSTLENIADAISKRVLLLAQRVEAQMMQKSVLKYKKGQRA